MKSWLKVKAAVVCLLCAVLLAPATAWGTGVVGTSGDAYAGAINWYYVKRYVDYPPSPGPEVAFKESTQTGQYQLFLGTHNCNQGDAGPIYDQYINVVRPVRYYSSPQSFCLFTYGSGGGGSFTGTLYWD